MKVLNKLAGIILAVCFMIPIFGTNVFAADGVLMFSDPSTKVGENVSLDLVVQSNSGSVGGVSVTMSYDAAALEFVSGDGFSADGSGTLTYTGVGNGNELRATMTFHALKATDTTLTVSNSSASLSTGELLTLDQGSSAIAIAAADDGTTSVEPTAVSNTEVTKTASDIVITVGDEEYNFSEAFTSTDIPEGYTETTLTFNGGERKFAVNEAGIYLGYLVDASGTGKFFLFHEEDATFVPFAQLMISDTTSIIPLDKKEAVKLPVNYQQSDLTVQDCVFPVWSDPAVSDRYYLIYALNTRTGKEGFYQYDSEDGTYQYVDVPEQKEEKTAEPGFSGKVGAFISNYAFALLIAATAVCLLLLILVIIFAVKLVHRNQELDDLYDEYDIPYEEDEDDEDGDAEYDDDNYDESDYDDYDDEQYSDDSDEKKKSSFDDDYNIDFIDL